MDKNSNFIKKNIPTLIENEYKLINKENEAKAIISQQEEAINEQKRFNCEFLEKIFKEKIENYQEAAFNTYLKEIEKAGEYRYVIMDLFSKQWWKWRGPYEEIHIVKYYTSLNNYELQNNEENWGIGKIELSFISKYSYEKEVPENKKIDIEEILKSNGEISKEIRTLCRNEVKKEKEKEQKQIVENEINSLIPKLKKLQKIDNKYTDKTKSEEIFKVIEGLNNLANDLNN